MVDERAEMTKLLDEAVAAVRQMPPETQDSMAKAILSLTRGVAVEEIEPEHLPFVLEGLAQIERGELATDREVAEAFRSFGP